MGEGTYKDDKLDGPVKWYYDNGQLREEGTYNNGKRDGLWKFYHQFYSIHNNGQLKEERTYKNDKYIDSKFY